jgi:hypothetical protein
MMMMTYTGMRAHARRHMAITILLKKAALVLVLVRAAHARARCAVAERKRLAQASPLRGAPPEPPRRTLAQCVHAVRISVSVKEQRSIAARVQDARAAQVQGSHSHTAHSHSGPQPQRHSSQLTQVARWRSGSGPQAAAGGDGPGADRPHRVLRVTGLLRVPGIIVRSSIWAQELTPAQDRGRAHMTHERRKEKGRKEHESCAHLHERLHKRGQVGVCNVGVLRGAQVQVQYALHALPAAWLSICACICMRACARGGAQGRESAKDAKVAKVRELRIEAKRRRAQARSHFHGRNKA